jgi:LysM repeat protein
VRGAGVDEHDRAPAAAHPRLASSLPGRKESGGLLWSTLRRALTRGLIASIPLTLAVADVAPAREPVWCHEVRRGDTLSSIARRHATSVPQLSRLNGLPPHGVLAVDRVLRLPVVVRLQRGDLPLATPPLTARPGRLAAENAAAAADGLSRMKSLKMVARFRRAGLVVPVAATTRTYYVTRVAPELRVTRPWTKRFILQLAAAFHELFDEPLRVSSLTRTVSAQHALRLTNTNAAPAHGLVQSTHLTGAAVDVSKRGLDATQVMWLRTVLDRLERRRLVYAAEEFREPHFHVFVRKRYLDYARRLSSPVLVGGC